MAVLGAAAGFRDVREWYTRVAILSRQVCLIEDEAGPLGTAFLVGPDAVLTATHVIDPRRLTFSSLRARFDFIADPDTGKLDKGKGFDLAPKPIVASSPTDDLDLALVRLADPIGERSVFNDGYLRGWVALAGANLDPVPGTAIAIFQHPEGGPLKVAMSTNSVVRYEEHLRRILYRTDTSPGASGAPCFDIDWRLIAMHTGFAYELGNFNMGVPVNLIVDWLRSNGHAEIIDRKLPARMKHVVQLTNAPPRGSFSLDTELKKLLGAGEGQRLELKERATKIDAKTAKISERLLSTVAAFMNSREGGILLIGVTNSGEFVGIENEYGFVNKQRADFDSYSMWLNSVIVANLKVHAALNYFTISRARESNKDICVISVQPAEMPVFLDKAFYVRQGSQNSPLDGHDMLAFITTRWSTQSSKTSDEHATPIK